MQNKPNVINIESRKRRQQARIHNRQIHSHQPLEPRPKNPLLHRRRLVQTDRSIPKQRIRDKTNQLRYECARRRHLPRKLNRAADRSVEVAFGIGDAAEPDADEVVTAIAGRSDEGGAAAVGELADGAGASGVGLGVRGQKGFRGIEGLDVPAFEVDASVGIRYVVAHGWEAEGSGGEIVELVVGCISG